MDALVKKIHTAGPQLGAGPNIPRPERAEAEEAVRTLIAWAGDDPAREGLRDTPGRVVNAYREFFQGYDECPIEALSRTFDDVGGYDDIVMLRDIDLNSHCEHHMVPFVGNAHVAYMPDNAVVGISKLARVVDIYSRRLQTQETMTAQIALTIDKVLKPLGVAVMIEAVHQCMSMRGVRTPGATTITQRFSGVFARDMNERARFFALIAKK